MYQLSPDLDRQAAARDFTAEGRARISPLLDEASKERLHTAFAEQPLWNRVFLHQGTHHTVDGTALRGMPEKLSQLHDLVSVDHGVFGYTYETLPLHEWAMRCAHAEHPLVQFHDFLNSPEMLDFFRLVTACPDVSFVDGQATQFWARDFLSDHDDAVQGKNRIAAYVVSLTPNWEEEDGGRLVFGDTREKWAPAANALSIFRVPTSHWVECVSPSTNKVRRSITGWVRTGTPEQPE